MKPFYLCLYLYVSHCFTVSYKFPLFHSIFSQQKSIKTPNQKPNQIKITEIHPFSNEKINGFYGLIGPDVDKRKVKTLYDLFTGDGIIQGVFIENNTIQYIHYKIQTEKIKYEKKHGFFSKSTFMTPIYMLLNVLGIIPNVLGLANTAFLHVHPTEHIYALFERDKPYKIDINYATKEIQTLEKIDIAGIHCLSGHSSYHEPSEKIHSIDYDILHNKVIYYKIDKMFSTILQKLEIKTKYIPIVHDFHVYRNTNEHDQDLLFIESPLIWNFLKSVPVFMDKRPTLIHNYHFHTKNHTIYKCNETFYIFHYAQVYEYMDKIEIYAPLYDKLDFVSLDINGKYRKIVIDKQSGQVQVIRNPELENLNLDFPVRYGDDHVLLRKMEKRTMTGFVLCKGLSLVKNISLPDNRFLCGEPKIVETCVLGLCYDNKDNGYFMCYDLEKDTYSETALNESVTIGFHSIYTSSQCTLEK